MREQCFSSSHISAWDGELRPLRGNQFVLDPHAGFERTLAGFAAHLAEPLLDVIALDQDGRPCIEAKCPQDLEDSLGLRGGNVFYRDLQWPWAESDQEIGTWGVDTIYDRVWFCGSGARRGGAASGVAGRSAAKQLLGRR